MQSNRTRVLLAGAIAFVSFALTAPADAQTFRDESTGLVVVPPPGYAAQPGPDQRTGRTVNVKRAEDTDTGCRVGFQLAPQNAKFSQVEINAGAMLPERQEVIRQTLSALYDVKTIAPFESGGVRGVVVLAEIRMTPKMPARASELQNILYMLETPKGRINIVCVVETTSYEQRRAEFEALARGVTVPR